MKLISNHELQKRSNSGSPERRNALASLENISRARAVRISQTGGGLGL
jgi:hypothetical protein